MLMDVLEIGLEDSELLAEIELVTELMIAATGTPGPLDQETIDTLLGVRPATQDEVPPIVKQIRRGES